MKFSELKAEDIPNEFLRIGEQVNKGKRQLAEAELAHRIWEAGESKRIAEASDKKPAEAQIEREVRCNLTYEQNKKVLAAVEFGLRESEIELEALRIYAALVTKQ